jgi:acetyl esterase
MHDRNPSHPFADQPLAEFVRNLANTPSMTASKDVGEMRRLSDARAAQRPLGPSMPTVDVALAGGRYGARLYRPSAGCRNLVVFLHGGGWTIGSVRTHDRVCRRLAQATGAPVLSVDYRLAPEYPAPAAIDDTVDVLEWVASAPPEIGRDLRAIAVVGESAGGALAALAAVCLRGTTAAPDLLVMLYPNTHLAASGGSMDANAHGFGLDATDVAWCNANWVPDRSRHSDPAFSPLMVPDLRGMPEAIIVSCELDPLRDQAEAFGSRLVEAGVPVRIRRELGMVHNFLLWDLISPACAAAGDRVASDIVNGFARVASRSPIQEPARA